MNNAKEGLLKGTAVYFIGNALIGIIQFLMLPIITGKLSPEEYGYYDMIVTTGNLLLPLITLQITDAVFRFFFNCSEIDKKRYFTTAVLIIFIGVSILAVGIVIITNFIFSLEYPLLIFLYFIGKIMMLIYTRMARCLNANVAYVKCNILKSFLYIFFQIIFLLVFKMGIASLFISNISSIIICVVILEKKIALRGFIITSSVNKSTLKEMLNYSIPLIPNTFLWWLLSSFNKYVVVCFLGIGINGIYVVANKFSTILTMITSVFLLAWQESVIKEYDKQEETSFYGEIAYQFINLVFSIVIVLIPIIKIVFPYLINEQYSASMPYAPILLLSSGMAAITGFYGSFYAATKKTIGIMKTTIYGVAINGIVVLSLVNYIGLFAPAIASLLGNFAIVVARYRFFKEEMNIRINWKHIVVLIIQAMISLFVYYYNNYFIIWSSMIIFIIIAFVLNKKLLLEVYSFIYGKIKKENLQ